MSVCSFIVLYVNMIAVAANVNKQATSNDMLS